MNRSTDVTSFTEHRARLREHFERVRETGRPLFVTTNGRTDAVVLSPATYDALVEEAELLRSVKAIRESERDIAAGRTMPAREAVERIARELGVTLSGCRDTTSS